MSQTHTPKTLISRAPKTHFCHYDFSEYRGRLPTDWVNSLESYFNEGLETGSFLRAVLENDFTQAIRRLHDKQFVYFLPLLTELLLEGAPSLTWGNAEAVAKWLASWEPGGFYHRPSGSAE